MLMLLRGAVCMVAVIRLVNGECLEVGGRTNTGALYVSMIV